MIFKPKSPRSWSEFFSKSRVLDHVAAWRLALRNRRLKFKLLELRTSIMKGNLETLEKALTSYRPKGL